jgi:transglutaminase-like putative cysteine protease
MKSAESQSAPPLQRALDYYFEVALYFLVLTGFGTLASTGGLDTPSILLAGAALVVRGFLLARRREVVISERWTTPLTIAYFGFFAADYLAVSHSFLPATVHLALFGAVIRMFSLRRERDYIMLAILAFLMVLASAVLTVDSVFLFSFAGFMLMAVATFILMEMRRSGQVATIHPRQPSDAQQDRALGFWLARIAPVLMLMILAAAGAIFVVLPRMSAGYLGAYSLGADLSTGFSDHVRLGQIGQIQQSNSVVMHIQIDGDTLGQYDLHWRGVALADFDGHTWSKPREQFVLQRWSSDEFSVPRFENAALPSYVRANLTREEMIHYRVLVEPIGTNVFFLAPFARKIGGNYRLLAADSGGAVYDLDIQHAISSYEAESDIEQASPVELRAAGRQYPPEILSTYLELPTMDARVAQLATQVTASARNDFDRASAIENYLRTRFRYTLELPRTPVADPIANFLFERRQGHCEYFASSMAVMLRSLGIPSRVVNGFRSDEFNDVTGNYVIRAKDAHAWVEAYFPGYGWHTFDPTPGGAATIPQGWSRIALYMDAMASFWREWIVSYDSSHQLALGQNAIGGTRTVWESTRLWAREHYESMVRWAGRTQKRMDHSPGRWTFIALGGIFGVLALANLGRVVRSAHEMWLRAHPERFPDQVAAMWYDKMARSVARHGPRKQPAQTPQEFVRVIEDVRLQEPVARFTGAYESARFGHYAEDIRRLPELLEEVELAARNLGN